MRDEFNIAESDLGEVPGAVIQTVDGATLSEKEVLAYCKEGGLYGFKMPRQVKFVEELPRTTAGKLRKKDLEHLFLSSASQDAVAAEA